MDSKRVERGARHHQSSESPPTRHSPSPLPSSYSTSISASETNYGSYNNGEKKNKIIGGGNVSRRSTSPLSQSSESHRSNRYSKGDDSPVDRRRRRRSRSRSSSIRSHKRSRSRDRDKERGESYKERSRKHSRRDRQSRSRSRSRERRRSRSRNKSRDKYRYRESRRYNRQASYESDATHDDINEPLASQSLIITQPNAFKNDGSFMEMFKKMQEQMQPTPQQQPATSFSSSASASHVLEEKTNPPPPLMVGKRRGGRILKTGMVAKPKSEPTPADQPKDAWSLYMAEVKKYREVCCQEEDNTRPLVK